MTEERGATAAAPAPSGVGGKQAWASLPAILVEATIVVVLCIWVVASHLRWARLWHEAPWGDYALHVTEASGFDAVLRAPGHLAEKLLATWAWPELYSSAVYLTSSLLAPWTGRSATGLVDSLSFYLPLLVLGAYLTGRAAGGPPVGATAVALVVADPTLLHAGRRYFLDMPLCAMILLVLAALIHTQGFRRAVPSVVCGVLLGVALLVKYTAAWFVAVPMAVALAWGLWKDRPPLKILLRFVIAAAIVGAALWALGEVSRRHGSFVLESPTLTPALSFQLTFGCLAASLLWFTFAWFQPDGVGRNFTMATAIACAIASPWAIVNKFIIDERWRAVAAEFPFVRAHLHENLGLLVDSLSWPVLIGAGLGTLAALFWPRRRPAMLLVLLATLSGASLTLGVLGASVRYLAPVTVLVSVMAVGAIPRIWWIAWPAFACSLVLPSIMLTAPPVGVDPASDECVSRVCVGQVAITIGNLAPDREPLAREIHEALGPARDVHLVLGTGPDLSPDDANAIYYLLAAYENWSGRPRRVVMMPLGPEGPQVLDLLPLQGTRQRVLASWNAEPAATEGQTAPDAVVLTAGPGDPDKRAQAFFERSYTRVPLKDRSVVLLRASDLRGAETR